MHEGWERGTEGALGKGQGKTGQSEREARGRGNQGNQEQEARQTQGR